MTIAPSFYFYDLETSGFSPRAARILQFAGQRTNMDLKPIGKPQDYLIKLSGDILPEPDAALVTGITPQETLKNGLSEAEFIKVFFKEVVRPGTIFVGFNNIRFDDEFMRFLLYRNFYDAYTWQWKDGNSRWDLLDVTRMTRALRPEGIKWPVNSEGISSNQLTLLTGINKLDHSNAHNALNDVLATIDFARLLKTKQPKLFSYLLELRNKKQVEKLVNADQPFIYSSGKYPSEYEKTSIVQVVANNPNNQGVLVYDLRQDPNQFSKMAPDELASIWRFTKEENALSLPIKTLKFNRCPAVAPLSTLDKSSIERLKLNMKSIEENSKKLKTIKNWPKNILLARNILDKEQQTRLFEQPQMPDNLLYDGFFNDNDSQTMKQVRSADPAKLSEFVSKFSDQRLKELLPLYKARNYPSFLNEGEKDNWTNYCRLKFADGKDSSIEKYFKRINEIRGQKGLTKSSEHLLSELEDYGLSIKAKLI